MHVRGLDPLGGRSEVLLPDTAQAQLLLRCSSHLRQAAEARIQNRTRTAGNRLSPFFSCHWQRTCAHHVSTRTIQVLTLVGLVTRAYHSLIDVNSQMRSAIKSMVVIDFAMAGRSAMACYFRNFLIHRRSLLSASVVQRLKQLAMCRCSEWRLRPVFKAVQTFAG